MAAAWGVTEVAAEDAEPVETEWARQRRVDAAAKVQHMDWLRGRFRARLEAEKDDRSLRLHRSCMLSWAGTLVSEAEARDMLKREFGVCVCPFGVCEHCRAWGAEAAAPPM